MGFKLPVVWLELVLERQEKLSDFWTQNLWRRGRVKTTLSRRSVRCSLREATVMSPPTRLPNQEQNLYMLQGTFIPGKMDVLTNSLFFPPFSVGKDSTSVRYVWAAAALISKAVRSKKAVWCTGLLAWMSYPLRLLISLCKSSAWLFRNQASSSPENSARFIGVY